MTNVHPFPAPETTQRLCRGCGKETPHRDAGGVPAAMTPRARAAQCTACGYTGGVLVGLPGQREGKHGGAW